MEDHFHPRCPPPVGLVPPVRVDPTGETGPTRGQAAGPGWRTSSRGLLVPALVELTVEQRILEAAARLPEGGMVTGWAALRLAGAAFFDGVAADGRTLLPVPVLLPDAARIRSPGVRVERSRRELPPRRLLHDVPCAPALDALLHELVRCADPRRAGVMVDMSLAAGVVDLPGLAELAAARRLPAAASYAIERACPHCRSPKESEMMQVWESELGFLRPLMNRQILDLDGRCLAVVDQIEVQSGTCGEYNGAAHRSRARHRRDEDEAALHTIMVEHYRLFE